jgi:hypothetical protein
MRRVRGRDVPIRGKEEITDKAIEKRRSYNREYMRIWRAASGNRSQEAANRKRWYYERKVRDVLRDQAETRENDVKPTCAFCGKDRPIGEIARLRISNESRSGYLEVRMPYCGRC